MKKNFTEYKDYLRQQVKHLLINNEEDLLSFTKFLINYGKVALKHYPQEVDKLAHQSKIYGFKEIELLNQVTQVQFKDQSVIIKTTDKKNYTFPLFSVADTLHPQPLDLIDLLILLSISLENKHQEIFQVVNFALSRSK